MLPLTTGAAASFNQGLEMTSFGTVQILAKRADLISPRFVCACRFRCHSLDMDLAQTNFHYLSTSNLERKGMR